MPRFVKVIVLVSISDDWLHAGDAEMNWLVGLAFGIPVVLINGFLLMMYPAIVGLGGPFGAILGYGFLISLIPGVLALLIRRLIAPSPPLQKVTPR